MIDRALWRVVCVGLIVQAVCFVLLVILAIVDLAR